MPFRWSSPSPEVLVVNDRSPRYTVALDGGEAGSAPLYEGDDLGAAWSAFLRLPRPIAERSRRWRHREAGR